ncbi:MAG TPA: hypothetical protein VHX65_18290 [Pirellulales bacterium]|jgi:hypothetical protein|nr:hypothetical protein [Pirellulales bacterium]
MGILRNALVQLDGRAPVDPAPAPAADISREEPQATAGSGRSPAEFDPMAADYSFLGVRDSEVGPAAVETTVVEPDFVDPAKTKTEPASAVHLFDDPWFNRTLELADAAIEATERTEEALAAAQDDWYQPKSTLLQPKPLHERPSEQPAADPLAEVSVDRSYGRLWDNLTAALLDSPPWVLIAAGSGAPDDAAWVLPTAVAFAQRNPGKVLLVDGTQGPATSEAGQTDRYSLNSHLGLSCRFGLSDVLRGNVDWRDAVEPTAVPRIGLLAYGADFFADSRLRATATDLVAEWKASYQLVLIRAADACEPMLAPFAAASDGTLLLLDLCRTSRAAAVRASSSLFLAGARLLGCVVRD